MSAAVGWPHPRARGGGLQPCPGASTSQPRAQLLHHRPGALPVAVHDALVVGAVPPADGRRHRGARLGASLEHKAVARKDAVVCESHLAQRVLCVHIHACGGGGDGGGGRPQAGSWGATLLHRLVWRVLLRWGGSLPTPHVSGRTCIVQHQLRPQPCEQRRQHLAQRLHSGTVRGRSAGSQRGQPLQPAMPRTGGGRAYAGPGPLSTAPTYAAATTAPLPSPCLQVLVVGGASWQRHIKVARLQAVREGLRRAVQREGEHRGVAAEDGGGAVSLRERGAPGAGPGRGHRRVAGGCENRGARAWPTVGSRAWAASCLGNAGRSLC